MPTRKPNDLQVQFKEIYRNPIFRATKNYFITKLNFLRRKSVNHGYINTFLWWIKVECMLGTVLETNLFIQLFLLSTTKLKTKNSLRWYL